MANKLKLLVIEDMPSDFLILRRHLEKHGLEAACRQTDTVAGLAALLSEADWDLVLSDFKVPGMDFRENLALIRAALPDVPVILVSGTIGDELAVEVLKSGVTDFVLKDNLARLVPAIERALREVAESRARRAAEQELREKDALLRQMSALARIGGWTFDPSAGTSAWTEEVAKICDLDEPCTAGGGLAFLQGESREKLEAFVAAALASGRSFNIEMEIATRRGSAKWTRIVGMPIKEDDRVVSIRGSLQDITDRKHGEMLLFEQIERAVVTLQSIGDAVITSDAKGVIDYMNPAAERLTGWTAKEATGRALTKVLDLMDERRQSPVPNPILAALAGEMHDFSTDCLLLRRDGGRSIVEGSAAPIRARNGEITGGVLVLRDVTEARGSGAIL